MSNVVAILQARMSSRRLPGKVLRPILGVPMILRQLERVLRAQTLQAVIVATSTDPSDDELVAVLGNHGHRVHRGPLENVLARFHQAATSAAAQHVVRLTGDCPLTDPSVIDQIVHRHLATGADYTSNTITPTFPDGLDVEVLTIQALDQAQREASSPSDLEHVTPYLYRRPELFRLEDFRSPDGDLSKLRWTVDETADFEFVSAVYEELYPQNSAFTSKDVQRLLAQRPDLVAWNQKFKRNEGFTP